MPECTAAGRFQRRAEGEERTDREADRDEDPGAVDEGHDEESRRAEEQAPPDEWMSRVDLVDEILLVLDPGVEGLDDRAHACGERVGEVRELDLGAPAGEELAQEQRLVRIQLYGIRTPRSRCCFLLGGALGRRHEVVVLRLAAIAAFDLLDAQVPAHGEIDEGRGDVGVLSLLVEHRPGCANRQALRRLVLHDDGLVFRRRADLCGGRIVRNPSGRHAEELLIPPARNDQTLERERGGEDQRDAGEPVPGVPERIRAVVRSLDDGLVVSGQTRLKYRARVAEGVRKPGKVDRHTLSTGQGRGRERRGMPIHAGIGAGLLGALVTRKTDGTTDIQWPSHRDLGLVDLRVPIVAGRIPEELVGERPIRLL